MRSGLFDNPNPVPSLPDSGLRGLRHPTKGPRFRAPHPIGTNLTEQNGKESVVTLVIPNPRLGRAQQSALEHKVRAILAEGGEVMWEWSSAKPEITITFPNTQDVKEVAARITFAKVRSVEAANRRIVLEPSSLTVHSMMQAPSAPGARPASPFKAESKDKDDSSPKSESPFKIEN